MRFLISTIALWALWIALTASFDPQELGAGLALSVFVSLLSSGQPFTASSVGIFAPKRFATLLMYIPYLMWAIVQSNFDVARRVVQPSLPINPGIVRVKTRLKSPIGRLFLTSSITLTPGTLTVDLQGDDIYIHWIDVQAKDIEGATRAIVQGFERYLEVIFG